jgi:hypothetical protein
MKANLDTLTQQLPTDSAGLTLATDSLPEQEHQYALVITAPSNRGMEGEPRKKNLGESVYVTGLLFVLIAIIFFKHGKSPKFFSYLFKDLTDLRQRNNMFDDTVRETTYLYVLNLLTTASLGVLLYFLILCTTPPDISRLLSDDAYNISALGICTGITLCYGIVMLLLYTIVGNVFGKKHDAQQWTRAHLSSQALIAPLIVLPAFLLMFYPGYVETTLIIGAVIFFIAKIVFIWKGIRIFYHLPGFYFLFLYYLCSLEVVPMILVYAGAEYLCRTIIG